MYISLCIFNFVMRPISFFLIIVVIRYLSIEKNRYMYIRLFPEPSRLSKEQPPIARFVIRVTISGGNRKPYISPGMQLLLRLLLFCSSTSIKKKSEVQIRSSICRKFQPELFVFNLVIEFEKKMII